MCKVISKLGFDPQKSESLVFTFFQLLTYHIIGSLHFTSLIFMILPQKKCEKSRLTHLPCSMRDFKIS